MTTLQFDTYKHNTMLKSHHLLRELLVNLLISIAIFAGIVTLLYFLGLVINETGDLKNPILPLEIGAAIVGTTFILTVRNPNNYYGFVVGTLMAILLGIQFYVSGFLDLTILYFFVFVPCQIFTFWRWLKVAAQPTTATFQQPSFLPTSLLISCLAVFSALFVSDLLLLQNSVSLSAALSSAVVATSILGNFLMIRKRTDAWFYWVAFALAGIGLMICQENYVTLMLYVFYLLINGRACVAWCRQTPRENYGWLRFLTKGDF